MPSPLTTAGVREIVANALRPIHGVDISSGLLGMNVLLDGIPQLTITPMRGQWLLQSRRALQVAHRGDVLKRQKSSDSEWETFVASTGTGVSSFVYQAAVSLAAQAELRDRRNKVKLAEVEFEPDRPLHWRQLALWAEATGGLGRSEAIWSRRYASFLAGGRSRSERFQRWARATARAAQGAGFRPTGESLDSDEPEDWEADRGLTSPLRIQETPQEDAEGAAGTHSDVVERLRALSEADLRRIGDLNRAGESPLRRQARAMAMRLENGTEWRDLRGAFLDVLEERKEALPDAKLPWGEIMSAGLDALKAEDLRGKLDEEERAVLRSAWYLGDPPGDP